MRMLGCDLLGNAYLLTLSGPNYRVDALIEGKWEFQAETSSYDELMILTDELGIIWP
jgi:hypothetical protein